MTTSTKPYLVRALYQWMLDNELTPFVTLDTTVPGVKVPVQYIKDGKIVLNISPVATQDLNITNTLLSFSASFSGLGYGIQAPIRAVTMIYAKETGQGMVFEVEDATQEGDGGRSRGGMEKTSTQEKSSAAKTSTKKPTLKVVK